MIRCVASLSTNSSTGAASNSLNDSRNFSSSTKQFCGGARTLDWNIGSTSRVLTRVFSKTYATSSAVNIRLIGTSAAPILAQPKNAATYSGELVAKIATES